MTMMTTIAVVSLLLSVLLLLPSSSTSVQAQTIPPPTPAPTNGPFCPVCLNGNRAMGNQNIGGVACQYADQLGRSRQLSAEECAYFQGLASTSGDPCECSDPTPQPTTTMMMMMATAKPTVAPTPEPTTVSPTTFAPTFEPTTSVPTPAPTVATPFCNICRDSPILLPRLDNPLGVIASLEQRMDITCQEAQDMAVQRGGRPGLTESQCLDFQALAIGTCGCPFEPTGAPVADTATATAAPSPEPDDTIPDCPVCQNGNPISNATGTILDKTCTEWNVLGTNGLLTLGECVSVQLLAQTPSDPCGCTPSTDQPTFEPTTVAPTAVPTLPPTPLADRVEFCNICRDAGFGDLSLGLPNATLASFISGGISIQCGLAQFLGSTLNSQGPIYTLEQCAIAQSLAVGTCGCPNEPTSAPVAAPAALPAVTPQPTDAPGVFCLICPNGNMATGLGVLGSMLCQDVDAMARASELTDEECLAAQTRAAQDDDPCGCSGGATPAPAVAPAPVAPSTTAAPVVVVPTTVAPTMMPTLALEPCNLCVNPFEFITNDDGVLFTDAITGVELTCEQAQIVGFSFGYTAQECNLLQFQASGTCGCPSDPATPTGAPATAPTTPAPVPPPSTAAPVGSSDTVFCTVCQNGTPTTSPGFIGGVSCGALDAMGRLLPDGTFTLFQCLAIQTAAIIAPGDPCNCNFVAP